MAPFLGPGKAEVLRKLRAPTRRGFPLTLGLYTPEAVIQNEAVRWVLREYLDSSAFIPPATPTFEHARPFLRHASTQAPSAVARMTGAPCSPILSASR
jgi:hypothetical protein